MLGNEMQDDLASLSRSVTELVGLMQRQQGLASASTNFSLDSLLNEFSRQKGSFLHLNLGAPPMIRIEDQLIALSERPLTSTDCRALAAMCLTPEQIRHCYSGQELDLNLIDGERGFRIHAYLERGVPGLSIRRIRTDIPKLAELGLSTSAVENFFGLKEGGLMILTGRPRSGKFNTYASLVSFVNQQQACRVVSIEPIIQFWHKADKAMVVQREVGSDTRSFARAVRTAVQQDPDVLVIGAIPDTETAEVVLQAAAGGHLVIAMMDGTSAVRTVDNFLAAFEQGGSRSRALVARTLRLVVCQYLLPRADRRDQIPAHEILECNHEVREALQKGALSDLPHLMEHFGMQTLGRHLSRMIEVGLVNYDDALKYVDAAELEVGRPSPLKLAAASPIDGVDDDTPLMSWL